MILCLYMWLPFGNYIVLGTDKDQESLLWIKVFEIIVMLLLIEDLFVFGIVETWKDMNPSF